MLVCSLSYAQFQQAPGNAPKGAKTVPEWVPIQQHVTGVNFLDNTDTVSTEAIANSGKAMLIDLSATWCSWCWVMHQNGIMDAVQNQLGSQVQCIWVEADPSTTDPSELTGSGSTQGNWTVVYGTQNTVPYPIINDANFAEIIGSDNIAGYPTVVLVTPSGYWCDMYGTDWGFGPYDASEAVTAVQTVLTQMPQAGVAPVVSLNAPAQALKGATVPLSINVISVDQVTDISWTIQGADPATATSESVSATWNTTGTYTISVTVTNTTGSTTVTQDITIFEWNWDETMSYSMGDIVTSYGAGSGSVWGAMFPAQFLTGRQYMKSVSLYLDDSGLGKPLTVTLYKGGETAPSTQFYTRTVSSLTLSQGWNTINCSGEVPIDATQNLWVVFSSTASYPMAVCDYTGDPNGSWAQLSGTWYNFATDLDAMGVPSYTYTFMIKATTGDSPNAGISTMSNIDMQLYPNPTTGKVNVIAEGVESVDVLDMTGRMVMSSTESVIDMSSLANGVYMFRVNTVNGSSMQKVVKK